MRIWTVCVSIVAHAIALAVVIVVPLFATGTLPVPQPITKAVQIVTGVIPPRPAASIQRRSSVRRLNPDIAPVTPPERIAPEVPVNILAGPIVDDTPSANGIDDVVPGDIVVGEPAPPTISSRSQAPLPVGGRILPPKKIRHVAPVYPRIALDAGLEGYVILEAIIDVGGSVQKVTVLRSIPLLDGAAVEAVRQWQFTPTRLNGEVVPVVMTVTVAFSLR